MNKNILLLTAALGIFTTSMVFGDQIVSGASNTVPSSVGSSISGSSSGASVQDNKSNTIKFSKQKWYITAKAYNASMTYYEMHLQIVGSTTATSLELETFGGGVIGSQQISINNGTFNQDVVIAFRMLQNSNVWSKYKTTVNLTVTYPNGQVVIIPISSPEIKYGQTINSAPATNSIAVPHGINSLPNSNN